MSQRAALSILTVLSIISPAAAPQNAETQERPPDESLLWDHVHHLEEMIRLWPRREYYLELAELYSRVGDSKRELELYEIAHAMGWLDQTRQYIVLARLRLEAGRPTKADEALQRALKLEAARSSESRQSSGRN